MSPTTRRSALRVAGPSLLTVFAGCSALGSTSLKAVSIVLHNRTEKRQAVSVRVTSKSDETERINTNIDLDPHGGHKFNNAVRSNEQYTVEIGFRPTDGSGEEFAETYEWNSVEQPLHVLLTDQVVFAEQVG
jgi:hypothetical protein